MNAVRVAAGLVLASLSLYGQYSNTVFETVFTQQGPAAVSNPVRNIGAQYQQITVQAVENSGGAVCAGLGGVKGDIHLEASNDATFWFPIGTKVTAVPINKFVYSSISGAFPFIRVNSFVTNPVDCAVNVWYAGTLTGTPTSSAPVAASNDNFIRQQSAITSVGYNGIAASCVANAGLPAIYGMTVANYDASVATVLTLVFATNGTGGSASSQLVFKLAAGQTLIWAQADRPWFVSTNSALLAVSFSATAASQTITNIIYRCE